jgi:hypothetical protein
VAEEILVDEDTQLRQGMRESLGGLPKVKKTSSFI